ncbi:MAG: response regulator [Bacteroidetes bacterium]|nr:MAG: response regulator [Bacteroidota bacterium]
MQNREILIVDDETDIRFLLGSILKQKNIQTVFASSLSEADNILKNKKKFDCIFLDNFLPDGLGVNHIKQIKNNYPQAKIVMITAHDNQTDREKASNEGADYFIGKPFSSESILKTIDRLAV